MNLKQKLFTTFGGLALLTIATAGMSLWTTLQWQRTNARMQEHYQRSLLVKRVQGATLGAFREIHDGVIGTDDDSQQEFAELLQPVEPDLQRWQSLAYDEQERQQVQAVRQAYEVLVQKANSLFALAGSGQKSKAIALLDQELEEAILNRFQSVTEAAIASDNQSRQVLLAQVDQTRRTTQVALSISAFATLSLALLLAAYLSSDLFSPLREVKQALGDVIRGDLQQRLDGERTDEFGEINRAFNQMTEVIAYREQAAGLAAIPLNTDLNHLPSRVMIHQLLSQLRSRISLLTADPDTLDNRQATIAQLDVLLQAVSRIAEFGFPLDLNLARTDIRLLIYEVIQRHQQELIQRAVSMELDLDPEVSYAVVDRLKLRSALSELLQNALSALPDQGGRIGLRVQQTPDSTHLKFEFADTGEGVREPLVDTVFTSWQGDAKDKMDVGLSLTKAIIQQHGGQISLDSETGRGTYVSILLPLGA